MKKNLLTQLEVQNSVYPYENYELKGELFFLENDELYAVFYEAFAPLKIIPLTKDLQIKELFIKGQLYGENKDGQIERIESESNLREYKKKAAYIIAEKSITTIKKEKNYNYLFPDKKVTSEYNLNNFGKALYTELAKWDFSSFGEILEFCRTWGLPTGVTISSLEEKTARENINIIWMNIDDFFKKVKEYQKLFSYFKALNTNDFSNLPTDPKEGEHIKAHSRRILTEEIHEKAFKFKLKGQEGCLIHISVFDDLFEAAYFYLSLSINSSAEMKPCKNCGHLFEVSHRRQKFCPVLPGRKRSSCEMAYNNRLKKEKRQKGEI